MSGRGGACLVLLVLPLIILLVFSQIPNTAHAIDEDKEAESARSPSENSHDDKGAELPHSPFVQHSHPKDLSLSEKAAVAVAGLVGPGTPKSVFDFRAKNYWYIP